jgi:peptidoglycan/xylan/chitin deacetylase (PgdA/CDA1 family)
VIRHALAPVVPSAARALSLPRTFDGEPAARGVVLTFDDGPHPEGTPAILDLLARAGARAMFFVVGEQVVKRPDLVAECHAAGHEIGLHGYRHRVQLRIGGHELLDDYARGVAAVEDAIGVTPLWHRPPYGIYSPAGLSWTREAGMRPLLWSRWGKDWRKFTTPERIAARATHGLSAGDVILLHDADFYNAKRSHERTVAALPAVIAQLRARELDTVLPV